MPAMDPRGLSIYVASCPVSKAGIAEKHMNVECVPVVSLISQINSSQIGLIQPGCCLRYNPCVYCMVWRIESMTYRSNQGSIPIPNGEESTVTVAMTVFVLPLITDTLSLPLFAT